MDSKPFWQSLSFWGLVFTVASPLAAKYGIVFDANSVASQVVTAISAVAGLIGVFRRQDIHLIAPK